MLIPCHLDQQEIPLEQKQLLEAANKGELRLCAASRTQQHRLKIQPPKGVSSELYAVARNKTSLLPLWDARFPSLSGTRESAFVHALAAAAVAHAIARACASGSLPLCSCGSAPSEAPGPDFRWGGCGDNLRYGLQLGAAFADSPVKSSVPGRTALRAVNLHNGAAGRQVGVRRDPHCLLPGSPGGAVLRVGTYVVKLEVEVFAETFPLLLLPQKMLPAHHKLLLTLPKGYVLITPQYLLKEGTPLSQ